MSFVDEVFNENPKAVQDAIKMANDKIVWHQNSAFNYLIGLVVRKTKGNINPNHIKVLIIKKLKETNQTWRKL